MSGARLLHTKLPNEVHFQNTKKKYYNLTSIVVWEKQFWQLLHKNSDIKKNYYCILVALIDSENESMPYTPATLWNFYSFFITHAIMERVIVISLK